MTKQDYIDYWVKTATKDWKVVHDLYKSRNYIHALFWGHLVLEKLLKAHWVKDHMDNIPPKIHHLVYLAEKTKLAFSEEDIKLFYLLNQFQLEGRYPDYIHSLHKKYKSVQTKKILDQIDIQRKCLLKKL